MLRAEHQKVSLEAIALKEEVVTLRHSLQRKLENLEKERNDVLHEQELYQQHMRHLEKKNEMPAPDRQSQQENIHQLDNEWEGRQHWLEHGAAVLKEWRENFQTE